MIVFGPVISKRLGHIIGIKNIPANKCSYSCVYCQASRTTRKTTRRKGYYKPEDIFSDLQSLVIKVRKQNKTIDYFTFMPCGESTLDINLGDTIDLIRFLGTKIAVITNSSLLYDDGVIQDLIRADYVSLKLDSVNVQTWHKLNRPHKILHLPKILAAMREFSKIYSGFLVTETRLIKDFNTSEKELRDLADFLKILNPQVTYLSVPILPTYEEGVQRPDVDTINYSYKIMNQKLNRLEFLANGEGNTTTEY